MMPIAEHFQRMSHPAGGVWHGSRLLATISRMYAVRTDDVINEEEAVFDNPVNEDLDVSEEAVEILEDVSPKYKFTGKDGTLSFEIKDGVNTIGRRQGDNDIVLND